MKSTLHELCVVYSGLVSRVNHSIGVIAVFCTLLVGSYTIVGAVDLKDNPLDCPKRADGTYKYRCLTADEYASLTEQYLEVRGQYRKLRWQKDHFGNIFRPWVVVGAEKLPNVGEYHPYGLAGMDIGRVSLWGGFFGDEPAYGVGWRIK